jgi:hypothetical protein
MLFFFLFFFFGSTLHHSAKPLAVNSTTIQPLIVQNWNDRPVKPIEELCTYKKVDCQDEFVIHGFNPHLRVRGDGSAFLIVAVVEDTSWLLLTLNMLVSRAKFHDLKGVTITTEDSTVENVFRRLGFYVYRTEESTKQFPASFNRKINTTEWSWGSLLFMKHNMWIEAFRRGVGFCSLDCDTTFVQDVLFDPGVDITMEGLQVKKHHSRTNLCKRGWIQQFRDYSGWYNNHGFSCHAYNERTLKFMQAAMDGFYYAIKKKIYGWSQPAYNYELCRADLHKVDNANLPSYLHHLYNGVLTKFNNMTISLFDVVAPIDPFGKATNFWLFPCAINAP